MSSDHADPITTTSSAVTPETNGYHDAEPKRESDPVRERFRLLAQCAKLRHWCRGLLDAEGSDGALPTEVERELLATTPTMTMDEVFAALRIISQSEPLPPGANTLTGEVSALATERQRLRAHFFALHDAVLGCDEMTEEYMLEQIAEGPSVTMADVLNQLDREFGGQC